jgi:fatty-acyl-CoA synthase
MIVPLTPLRFKKRAIKLYGKKIGVVCGDQRFTYRQFNQRSNQLSRALIELGVKPGDRVAFLSYNCHRLLEAYYGVVQIGAILMPLNIRLSPYELGFILNDSEAAILFFDQDFLSLVESFRSELQSVKQFVCLQDGEKPAWALSQSYDELLAEKSPDDVPEPEVDENEVAELFYTSGTTGDPKGVMLTHRNLYLNAINVIGCLPGNDNDVQLHTIPLFHVNGWGAPHSLTCIGGTHVMIKRFDPKEVLDLIERERVTRISMVPTMANALLHHPDWDQHDLSSLRIVNLGGAPTPIEIVKAYEERLGCQCIAGYGLTETSPILTLAVLKGSLESAPPEERYRRQAMTGLSVPGVELRVVDEQGQDVPNDGEHAGEIIVRADVVMEGYWKRPEDTAKVIKDGWFHTGDMATIDEEGYVLIVDRKKDLIISGGENISSVEIEKALYSHPAVFECAVIPVPDERWGEIPKALVVLKENQTASEEELIDYCRSRLAHFKVPKSIEFMDSLPKGGTGKILKKELREQYWRGQAKRVH